MICFDAARRILRIDVEGIEVSTQLLGRFETLNYRGSSFKKSARSRSRFSCHSAGVDTTLLVRVCHGLFEIVRYTGVALNQE